MENISRLFYLLALVFLVLGLLSNITHFPKLPGDILIDKPGIKIYIPLTSSIILSIILSLLFNFLR